MKDKQNKPGRTLDGMRYGHSYNVAIIAAIAAIIVTFVIMKFI